MRNRLTLQILFFAMGIILMSCTEDKENKPVCQETNVSMVVNGELQTFQAIGYGIDLTRDGYILQINLDRRNNDPFQEQGIYISLPYKKTGKDVIKSFIYHQYIDKTPFDGDFIDGELESNVLTNNKYCFYATFSGKLSNGSQEVTITDGKLSYQYETPFED